MKLKKLVLQSAESGEVMKEQENNFGKIYRLEYQVEGVNQKEILRTLWIVHKGGDTPYLTSCFIKKSR